MKVPIDQSQSGDTLESFAEFQTESCSFSNHVYLEGKCHG